MWLFSYNAVQTSSLIPGVFRPPRKEPFNTGSHSLPPPPATTIRCLLQESACSGCSGSDSLKAPPRLPLPRASVSEGWRMCSRARASLLSKDVLQVFNPMDVCLFLRFVSWVLSTTRVWNPGVLEAAQEDVLEEGRDANSQRRPDREGLSRRGSNKAMKGEQRRDRAGATSRSGPRAGVGLGGRAESGDSLAPRLPDLACSPQHLLSLSSLPLPPFTFSSSFSAQPSSAAAASHSRLDKEPETFQRR